VPIAFALAFAKSLAFVSLILPSWATLVGIGALMKTGGLEFVLVWIATAIGAALGDWLSYWIGTKRGSSLPRAATRSSLAHVSLGHGSLSTT
jgi:membrane protein DedA with SNARE-associated domain